MAEYGITVGANRIGVDITSGPNLGGGALVASALLFGGATGVLLYVGDAGASNPFWVPAHALFALSFVLLAVGATAVIRWLDAVETGLVGLSAVGVSWLSVLFGLEWLALAYADVVASRTGTYGLLDGSGLAPFGIGHFLVSIVLVSAAVALLGGALARSSTDHYTLGRAGVALGVLGVFVSGAALLTVAGGASTLFGTAMAVGLALYLWTLGLGGALLRHGAAA